MNWKALGITALVVSTLGLFFIVLAFIGFVFGELVLGLIITGITFLLISGVIYYAIKTHIEIEQDRQKDIM